MEKILIFLSPNKSPNKAANNKAPNKSPNNKSADKSHNNNSGHNLGNLSLNSIANGRLSDLSGGVGAEHLNSIS